MQKRFQSIADVWFIYSIPWHTGKGLAITNGMNSFFQLSLQRAYCMLSIISNCSISLQFSSKNWNIIPVRCFLTIITCFSRNQLCNFVYCRVEKKSYLFASFQGCLNIIHFGLLLIKDYLYCTNYKCISWFWHAYWWKQLRRLQELWTKAGPRR